MAKIAIIGDSYSAYTQEGQQKYHWSWLMAQNFPQHEYYNYARGGHGYDYYRWCLLDAKIREMDIVFINRTFNHRVALLVNDSNFNFNQTPISDNYHLLELDDYAYLQWSGHMHFERKKLVNLWNDTHSIDVNLANDVYGAMEFNGTSDTKLNYNNTWFDNVEKLYNFKHIIPLELININYEKPSATKAVAMAHGIEDITDEQMYSKGLTISVEDQHYSLKANTWVLDNWILTPEVIDILDKYQ